MPTYIKGQKKDHSTLLISIISHEGLL